MKKPLLIIVALVLFVILAARISCRREESKPVIPEDLNTVIGRAAGEQVVALLGGKGTLALLTTERSLYERESIASQLNGFRQALAAHPGLSIAGTRVVNAEPAMAGLDLDAMLPEKDFLDALREFAAVDAIVSFIGYPTVSNPSGIPAKRPRLVVIETIYPPNPLRAGRTVPADVAIVSKTQPGAAPAPDASTEEQFRALFDIIKTPNR